MAKKIIVIGGGISGLSAAYTLMKEGADVSVVEKNPRAGGCIRTGKEDGYLFEYGPNSTMNSNDEIDSLCMELGLKEERIFGSSQSKKRYVMRRGQPIALPMSIIDFIKTKLWSFQGKLRLFKEPFIGRYKGDDETVADFVTRRIGRELLDYALDPFVSGVYAGNPEHLSLKSTFPKMKELEDNYKSLILGALRKVLKREKSNRPKGIFSFKQGMDSLPKAIADTLGNRFKGGTEVKKLEKRGERYLLTFADSTTAEADRVIMSSPAYVNAEILSSLAPHISNELAGIEYAPIVVVYIGFKREVVSHLLDGFGCLIPLKEQKQLLGSLWNSSLFPHRAPQGHVSLTCFTGGSRNKEMINESDEKILSLVLNDLKDMVDVKGSPSFIKIIRHKKAIPQYNTGHFEKLKRIEKSLLLFPGLHLLGNYLQGISLADCAMNGINMGRKINQSD